MKLKPSFLHAVLICIIYAILAVIAIFRVNHNTWLANGGYFINNQVIDLGDFRSSNGNLKSTNSIKDAEFVAVDTGYSFDNIEEFEYYGTYESPVILATKHKASSETIDLQDFAEAVIDRKEYEELGIKSASLSGSVTYAINGLDVEEDVIEELLSKVYGEGWGKLRRKASHSGSSVSTGIYIQFAYENEYEELPTNIPHVSLIVDVYRRVGISRELDDMIGFTRVDKNNLGDIINIKNMPEVLEAEPEEKADEPGKAGNIPEDEEAKLKELESSLNEEAVEIESYRVTAFGIMVICALLSAVLLVIKLIMFIFG